VMNPHHIDFAEMDKKDIQKFKMRYVGSVVDKSCKDHYGNHYLNINDLMKMVSVHTRRVYGDELPK